MMPHTARGYGFLALRILGTAAFLAWLVRQVDLSRILDLLRGADWSYIVLCSFPVSMVCVFINVLRWRLILVHQGNRPPWINLSVVYLKATFLSVFLPGGKTTGEVFRIRFLAKETQDIGASIRSVFLDRAAGFVALLLISFGALAWVSIATLDHPLRALLPQVILISGSLGTIIVILVSFRQLYLRKAKSQNPIFLRLQPFLEVVPKYLEDKRLVAHQLALSLLLQLVIVSWSYVVANALHISVPFMALLIATPLVGLFQLFPISLGAFGVREAGYVFCLAPFGVSPGEATSLGLVCGVVQDFLRVTYGVVFFWDPSKERFRPTTAPFPGDV